MKRRVGLWVFLVGGLIVAGVLAFVVSPEASTEPDGLEKVAIDEGFMDEGRDHDLGGTPTADYEVDGIDSDRLSTGVAGVIGLVVTGAVTVAVCGAVRRAGRRRASAAAGASEPAVGASEPAVGASEPAVGVPT
jgi:hypothetical protein